MHCVVLASYYFVVMGHESNSGGYDGDDKESSVDESDSDVFVRSRNYKLTFG
jgi:hypothetical protein